MEYNLGKVLLTPKGEYNGSTTYEILDVVSYNGSSYVAKQPTTGNAPSEGQTNQYWQLLASGVIPNGIDILELSEEEGTLTQEQIALVQSDHCIIVFDYEYYYKNYLESASLEYALNYIDGADYGIGQKLIEINTNAGSYIIEEHSLDIQSDWDESDSTSVAYIKNKPNIPTVPVQDVTVGGTSVVSNGTAVIPAIPDTSGKEDRMLISSASGTTLSAVANTYHNFTSEVNTLAITLPAVTDVTHITNIVFMLTTGTTPAITFAASGTGVNVIAQDGFSIEASTTYEINAIFNGIMWVVAAMKLSTTPINS